MNLAAGPPARVENTYGRYGPPSQCHKRFRYRPTARPSRCLSRPARDLDTQRVVIPSQTIERLSILPANQDLLGAELEMVNAVSREHRLTEALKQVQDDYDFAIIDCPPSLGLLTLNSLSAANSALIPLQCEYYALEGLSQLTATVDLIRRGLNPRLQIEGFSLRCSIAGTIYPTKSQTMHVPTSGN